MPRHKLQKLKNRFNYCRCVVFINAKVIYHFEVRVLKRFFCKAWFSTLLLHRRFLLTLKVKISGKGLLIVRRHGGKLWYRIKLAVLGQRALQELQVKAPRPSLGKLEGLGGWTLQRREAQGSIQII